jgi:ATP-binding cassette subfamily B protein
MAKLSSLSIGQHTGGSSALKQTVISAGQQSLTTMVNLGLHQVLPMAVELIVVTSFLLFMSAHLGLMMLAGSAVFAVIAIWMNARVFPRIREHEKLKNREGKYRSEFIRYMPMVIASGQEARAVSEVDEGRALVNRVHLDIWIPYVIQAALRDMLIVITRFAVMAYGCKLVLVDGTESVGSIVALWYWATGALNRVNTIGGLYRDLAENASAVAEYFELMDTRPRVTTPPAPIRPAHCRGKIRFNDVWFAYPARTSSPAESSEPSVDDNDSLRGIDLTINPGETVAVVGPSGAGKSTLMKLLLRADDPQRGSVAIDGTDLRELEPAWLRSAIGVVEQDIKLFDKSLRYNLTFALDEATRAAITERELDDVARLCRVDEFLVSMEHGYDTIIGEHGVQLSGGQRQRVGIARAVIKNPSVLLLDEATSNLDAESEELIRSAMDRVRRNRTTIIVAHRFSTIRNADRVLVMDGGRIVDQGTHQELESRCEVYQRLLRNQRLSVL